MGFISGGALNCDFRKTNKKSAGVEKTLIGAGIQKIRKFAMRVYRRDLGSQKKKKKIKFYAFTPLIIGLGQHKSESVSPVYCTC